MRQKSDISERRSKGRLTVSLCDLSGGHLTPKMNIALFIRNLMLNIFLFNIFFEKKLHFQGKPQKNVFGGAFDNFSGKEGALP